MVFFNQKTNLGFQNGTSYETYCMKDFKYTSLCRKLNITYGFIG